MLTVCTAVSAIFVRLKEDYRNQVEKLNDILINAPVGGSVPLGRLAKFHLSIGDAVVSRENALRRLVVKCNVTGRDIGGFVHAPRRLSQRRSRLHLDISLRGAGNSKTRSRQRAGC